MAVAAREETVSRLNEMGPEELFAWALEAHGDRAGIITSFQDTGCVMIDLMCRVAPGLRVITVDTLRLHDATYAVMDAIEGKYGIEIERFRPDPERLAKMVAQHGEYLFFDSKPKQEFCCNVRKVEPNQRALETLDVWFTGLRRDQSEFRAQTPRAQLVDRNGRKIIKVAPLVDWDQARIDAYIAEHDVPKNALYDEGYTSISCVICTTPTLPHEDKRAGRWRWFSYLEKDDKECGIHIGGSGI
ncbi:MAG TPA: phosphoadenylyl-sulfate reductase [Candidatus Hydrogenedentes bacterium]|nr:phosphoadenylyl-sulfate reductase [Candidatus Hydrogenedentota bacterium]